VRALLARPAVNALSWALPLGCLAVLLWPPQWVPLPLRWSLLWGGVTALMYMPLVLQLVSRPSPVARFLGHRAWLFAATFGYGIYLVHIPLADRFGVPIVGALSIALALKGFVLPLKVVWAISVAFTFGLSLAAAWVLHVVVEKPMLALRDRLVPGRG
jgi:peptidoglycan/LPS O-acetylase OafA/YrhL